MRNLTGREAAAYLSATLERVSARLSYLRWTLEPPILATQADEQPDALWLACDELVHAPPRLKDVIVATGHQLGTDSAVVASSLFVQSYAYRVLVFAVACLTVGGVLPPSDAASMAVGIARGRASLVGYRTPRALLMEERPGHLPAALANPARREAALAILLAEAIDDHLRLLIDATATEIRVGRRLLWGNVAASAAVAFRTMEGLLGPWVRSLGEAFFQQAPLELQNQGTFLLLRFGTRHGWFWERTNCCLNDRLPERVRCGDCSKTPVEQRRAAYRQSILGGGGP